jgi:hypothetical protein
LPAGYTGNFVDVFELTSHVGCIWRLSFDASCCEPFDLANPVWVQDDDPTRISRRSAVLPKPGSREQLDRLVGKLHSKLIDRAGRCGSSTSSKSAHIARCAGRHPPRGLCEGAPCVAERRERSRACQCHADVTPVPREVRAL